MTNSSTPTPVESYIYSGRGSCIEEILACYNRNFDKASTVITNATARFALKHCVSPANLAPNDYEMSTIQTDKITHEYTFFHKETDTVIGIITANIYEVKIEVYE